MGAGAARSAPEQLRSVSWLCGGVTAGGSWGRQGLSVAGAARGYETPKQARRWRDKPGLGSPGGQKMKTHKGAKKRFFVTHTGKVMCMPQGKQHLNYGTSGRKRQTLRKKVRVHPGQEKAIKMLLMLHRRPLNPKTPGKSKVRLMLKSAQPTA
ncbi:hypothetical protein T484DRAFT_1742961 [Baffinella frigidus]|nr:hypothetical protein T484DRAFT_1742961 [Cryptophyta sp. CCMP2293]